MKMKRLEVELEYNCNCRKSEKSLPIRYYFDSRDIAQIIFDNKLLTEIRFDMVAKTSIREACEKLKTTPMKLKIVTSLPVIVNAQGGGVFISGKYKWTGGDKRRGNK